MRGCVIATIHDSHKCRAERRAAPLAWAEPLRVIVG
jgi:hypothetical protein